MVNAVASTNYYVHTLRVGRDHVHTILYICRCRPYPTLGTASGGDRHDYRTAHEHAHNYTTIFYFLNFFFRQGQVTCFSAYEQRAGTWIFIGVQYIQTRLLTGNRVRICRMELNSQGEVKKWWG